jgi:hypothetical protein
VSRTKWSLFSITQCAVLKVIEIIAIPPIPRASGMRGLPDPPKVTECGYAEAGEKMTVRPTWWQPSIVIYWAIVAGSCVVAAVLRWPGGDYSFGALLLLWLLAWARVRTIRLDITEKVVRRQRGLVGPDKYRQVARSRIRAIHYYPNMISFSGPGGRPLMRTKAEWSLKQMVAVAAELQVPIYDNRRFLNLLPARVGRPVYKPFDDRPAR